MQKKIWYIIAAGVGFLFIIGGGIYYYQTQHSSLEQKLVAMSKQQSKQSLEAFNADDYTASIEGLPALIAKAPTKTERGRLQLLLASNLLYRNQGDDWAQAIPMLQQIINDYSITPWVRALAYNNLATLFVTYTLPHYEKYFTNPPLSAYAPVSTISDDDRARAAYLKVLQLSDEISPNSSAEYSIAGNYYTNLVVNNEIAKDDLENTAKLMQTYVTEGDNRNDKVIYSPSTILFGQMYRAFALAVSGRILNTPTLEEREAAFKLVFTTADTYKNAGQDITTPFIENALLKTRFFYADFLLKDFNGTRNVDIQTLLRPYGVVNSTSSATGVLPTLQHGKNAYLNAEAKKMAEISPEFKKFLTIAGIATH